MSLDNFSTGAVKISVIFMTIIGLLAALSVGQAIGSSEYTTMTVTIGGIFGFFFFLLLGSKYWIAIPFSLAAQIPALPLAGRAIELPEIVIAVCAVIYLARIALKMEKLRLWRITHLPILFFMAWVGLIYALNPTGFAMLGSGIMGGRFYIKIALGFISFVILANQRPSNADIKWVFVLIIIGAILSMSVGLVENLILGHSLFGEMSLDSDPDNFYSWHQILAGPAVPISMLIFSRYKPSVIFGLRRPMELVCYGFMILLVLLSGKRMALATILMAPLASIVIYRQYRYLFLAGVMSLMAMTFVVTGQGNFFRLPLTVQRALSWLPAEWDSELQVYTGGSDVFREELRRIAMIQIRRNPFLGVGYAIDFSVVVSSLSMEKHAALYTEQIYQYAAGKNWHNRWLGYSADFGIPLAFILAIIYLAILYQSFRLSRRLPHPEMKQVFSVYVFISTVAAVMSSHTSGHSALDAYYNWWMYGLLFAIAAMSAAEDRNQREQEKIALEKSYNLPVPS